jgi:hypothetical protein
LPLPPSRVSIESGSIDQMTPVRMADVQATIQSDIAAAVARDLDTKTLSNSGWHVYANPPGLDDLAGAQTTVTVSAKMKNCALPYRKS